MGSDQERLSAGAAAVPRIACVVPRFPKLTETFVLREMLALEELGIAVELFPLFRRRDGVEHPEAAGFARRARHVALFSREVLDANLAALRRQTRRYFATLFLVLRRTLPSPRFLLGALVLFPKAVHFARTMRRLGVQHIHAHFASHGALAALVAHRLSGIPFSFTAHGSDLHVDQTALRWKLEEAAWAVTVSEHNREFVRKRLGDAAARKLQVIHCGVETGRLLPAPPPDGESFEIACVAALREVKGHVHLINACGILRDRGLRFRCHLVGDGPLERPLRRHVARHGLGEQVRFHGPLAHPDVLARMHAAHVVALCSIEDRAGRREGVPVALMEAMSCGLPVVASRISGIPELVRNGHSGLLTPPGDAWAIADALEYLARSPAERLRLGAAGRAAVVRDFDLGRCVRRLADAIRGGIPRPGESSSPVRRQGGDGETGVRVLAGANGERTGDEPVALAPDGPDAEAVDRRPRGP